jgi:hypothetical protein
MRNAVILEGTVDEAGVLHVDKPVELPAGKVRVTVEPEVEENLSSPVASLFALVRSYQFNRPTEELMAELKGLRDEWEH